MLYVIKRQGKCFLEKEISFTLGSEWPANKEASFSSKTANRPCLLPCSEFQLGNRERRRCRQILCPTPSRVYSYCSNLDLSRQSPVATHLRCALLYHNDKFPATMKCSSKALIPNQSYDHDEAQTRRNLPSKSTMCPINTKASGLSQVTMDPTGEDDGSGNGNDHQDQFLEEFENDDWAATCAIYCDNDTIQTRSLPLGGFYGSLDIPVSITNVVFAWRTSGDKAVKRPAFRYWTLAKEEAPMVRLRFHFNSNDDAHATNVDVSFCRFPPTDALPSTIEEPFLSFLAKRANELLLEESMSYAVCQFVAHEALQEFFTVDHVDERHGYTLIVMPGRMDSPFLDDNRRGVSVHPLAKHPTVALCNSKYSIKGETDKAFTLDMYATKTIIDRWKYHFEFECPICFDKLRLGDAFAITCGHVFCKDCISMYAKVKVSELTEHERKSVNPFLCPVTSCRRGMLVIGCVKKLLPEEDMNKVRAWYKNLTQPPCWSLPQCMNKKCGKEGTMRRPTADNPIHNHFVFCEECNVTWCELCLKKVLGGKEAQRYHYDRALQYHDEEECDPSLVIQFCQRYLASSDTIKAKCEARYPWIKIYANAQAHDAASMNWIQQHGQTCPLCKTGVERSEGCFHMQCSCGAHFCYECGEELFPPYYGTHHCWERDDNHWE
jgi:hypothetical protein